MTAFNDISTGMNTTDPEHVEETLSKKNSNDSDSGNDSDPGCKTLQQPFGSYWSQKPVHDTISTLPSDFFDLLARGSPMVEEFQILYDYHKATKLRDAHLEAFYREVETNGAYPHLAKFLWERYERAMNAVQELEELHPGISNPWERKQHQDSCPIEGDDSRLKPTKIEIKASSHYRVRQRKGSNHFECCITGTRGNRSRVKLAHLLPASCSIQQSKLFGVQRGSRKDPRNLLFLATNIAKAFDEQRIAFDMGVHSFTLIILDAKVRLEPIFPSAHKTIGDFEGAEMKISPRVELPYRSVLSHHARWAFFRAVQKRWIQTTDLCAYKDFGFSPVEIIRIAPQRTKTVQRLVPKISSRKTLLTRRRLNW